MLARPEIGTKAHILLWLASKPPEESFYWRDWTVCACGQYSFAHYGDSRQWTRVEPGAPIHELNQMARWVTSRVDGYGKFGDLYRQAMMVWYPDDFWKTESALWQRAREQRDAGKTGDRIASAHSVVACEQAC
jgi:hypothetical protein